MGGATTLACSRRVSGLHTAMLASPYLCLSTVLLVFTASYANCEETLVVANLTTAVVDFVYSNLSSGRGLRVLSTQDSLHLTTLDGGCLIAAKEASRGSLRLISIGHTMFIQAKTGSAESRDFFVPDAFTGVISNADEEVLRDLVRMLNTSSTAEQENDARLWNSLLDLLRYPEMQLLQTAVAALASTGVTGLEYPSALSFYMTALNLEQFVQQSNLTEGRPRRSTGKPQVMDDCLSECPPCPSQECLGLCGYSCNCWKWVCGDCCYHLGCYEHDICCRKKFVRTACLFPFNFRCKYGYACD